VQRVFVPTTHSQVRLWDHSIFVAVATQQVAELIPDLKLDPGVAYLAGLLHDVGRFVMFEHAPAELLKVDESNWQSPDELLEADVDIFTYTHCEPGYLACRRWRLPDEICHLVRAHHSVLPRRIEPSSRDALVFCIQIADRVSMSVLEVAPSTDLSTTEVERRIKESCVGLTRDRTKLPFESIAGNVGRIRTEALKLLAGLGLSSPR
jgi:putative nucleotidyltransferase with HDIG domain